MTINRNLSILAGGVSSAGVLGVPNGGSGATTLTGYLIGNGTSAFTASATIPTSALSGTVNLTSQVSGILPFGNGGTGLSSTPANGALDIGNGTGFTRTTLTAGSGISITNASGSITVANTQNTGPAFRAYAGSNVVISSATWTKVTLNTENFDTNNNFDSTTNYRFTPTVAGYYQINGTANGQPSGTAPVRLVTQIYKNGVGNSYGTDTAIAGTYSSFVSDVIFFNGSTDYVELYVYINATTPTVNSGSASVFMSGALVRTS